MVRAVKARHQAAFASAHEGMPDGTPDVCGPDVCGPYGANCRRIGYPGMRPECEGCPLSAFVDQAVRITPEVGDCFFDCAGNAYICIAAPDEKSASQEAELLRISDGWAFPVANIDRYPNGTISFDNVGLGSWIQYPEDLIETIERKEKQSV